MVFCQMMYRFPILLDASTAALQRKGDKFLAKWADIMTGKSTIYSNAVQYIGIRSGLVIQVVVQCPVVHSDQQHMNEQLANLMGDRCPGRF